MAKFKEFDLTDAPEEGKLDDGWHNFKIRGAKKIASTKTMGQISYVFNFQVISGRFNGEEIALFIDKDNPENPARVKQGLRQLRQLLVAINKSGFDKIEDLIGAKFSGRTKINGDFCNLVEFKPSASAAPLSAAPNSGGGGIGGGRFANRNKPQTESAAESAVEDDDIPL